MKLTFAQVTTVMFALLVVAAIIAAVQMAGTMPTIYVSPVDTADTTVVEIDTIYPGKAIEGRAVNEWKYKASESATAATLWALCNEDTNNIDLQVTYLDVSQLFSTDQPCSEAWEADKLKDALLELQKLTVEGSPLHWVIKVFLISFP